MSLEQNVTIDRGTTWRARVLVTDPDTGSAVDLPGQGWAAHLDIDGVGTVFQAAVVTPGVIEVVLTGATTSALKAGVGRWTLTATNSGTSESFRLYTGRATAK